MATLFIILLAGLIITKNFWKNEPPSKCSFCGKKLNNCKITVKDENGTKVYCDPECLENGLKNGSKP